MGLIRLTSVTTGNWDPFAYITPIDAVRSRPNARSTWAFDCHVWPTWKSGSIAHGDCWLNVPDEMGAGNAGAPADVPLNVEVGARGRPRVVDVLPVEPRLVAVRPPDQREVVDHLRDVLLEVEAGVALTGACQRTAESCDTGNRHRRSCAGIAVGHRLLMPVRVLRPELVQHARAERRVELPGDRIHRVEEVGGALQRQRRAARRPAAAVVRRVVVKTQPA